MKLKHLGITNVAGIKSADIAFNAPITLFWGPNGAGKTSIRNALEWLLTAKARGIKLKKDMNELSTDAGGKMKVELLYIEPDVSGLEALSWTRTLSKGPAVKWPDAVAYALDGTAFVRLPAKDRAAILADALGGDNTDIVKAAITKHIGDVDPQINKLLKQGRVDLCNLEDFQKAVIEIRRDYKGEVETYVAGTVDPADFNIEPGFDSDAAQAALKVARDRIKAIHSEIENATAIGMRRERLATLQKDHIALLKTKKPVPKFDDDPMLDAAAQAVTIAGKIIAHAHEKNLNSLECPVCGAVKQLNQFSEQLSDLSKKHQKAINKLAAGKAQQEANDQINFRGDALMRDITALQNELKKVGETPTAADKSKELAEQTEIVSQLTIQLAAVSLYNNRCTEVATRQAEIPTMRRLIDECNRIDTALKDGGPVKEYIASHGKQLPLSEHLIRLWFPAEDTPLQWFDDGRINLHGRPIELASESEKYRVSGLMSMALAKLTGLGFCCLDGYEILAGSNANVLIDAAADVGLNNILIFVTKSDMPTGLPAGTEIYIVKGGEVMPFVG